MARHTPWTKRGSSLPSDHIPSASRQQGASHNTKVKGEKEEVKSKEIRKLESLLQGIHKSLSATTQDPRGGCFCLAREHSLSIYTPICHTCGLILCELNLPQHSCPHCHQSLLTPVLRDSIVSQLDTQIAATIAKEIADRESAIEEARKAVGAFPALPGVTSNRPTTSSRLMSQNHKVLTLNSKTKKVTVSSHNSSPAHSRPISRDEENDEDQLIRVPPPPQEVRHAKRYPDPTRPWENLGNGGAKYIPLPQPDVAKSQAGSKSRRHKGKEKEKNDDDVVLNQT